MFARLVKLIADVLIITCCTQCPVLYNKGYSSGKLPSIHEFALLVRRATLLVYLSPKNLHKSQSKETRTWRPMVPALVPNRELLLSFILGIDDIKAGSRPRYG